MGRHSGPSRAQQARARTLKAAAALGLAGFVALVLQSTVDDQGSSQARPGVDAPADEKTEVEPTAVDTPVSDESGPSASAERKDRQDERDRTGGDAPAGPPATQEPATGTGAGPTEAPAPPADTERPDAAKSAPAPAEESADTGSTATTKRADASPRNGNENEGGNEDRDKGLVGGVVDGVTGTVEGVTEDLGSSLGLLGR